MFTNQTCDKNQSVNQHTLIYPSPEVNSDKRAKQCYSCFECSLSNRGAIDFCSYTSGLCDVNLVLYILI